MELDKNQHSVYSINYHLVMVIKYRRKVISDEISGYLRATFERIGITYGVELVEWNHDKDHVHVLFKCTPQIAPAKFINAYKSDGKLLDKSVGIPARNIRREYSPLQKLCLTRHNF